MFTEPGTLTNADANRRADPYAAAQAMRARGAMIEVTQSGTKKPPSADRMAWVAHVKAIRDRQDQAAFAELFGHFAPRVKAFLMKSGASPELAEECTQEAMTTLWRKAHMFDPAKACVSTWIFTVARNRKIDILRKERRPEPE